MTNTKLFLLIGTSLSLIPHLTSAQCVATQDCATLGYTETSCSGGSGVKCPFGNKWACFKSESEICNDLGFTLTCTGSNQTGGSGKACNGKYTECTCAAGYEWDASSQTCKYDTQSNCILGTLYYSDGTCSDKLESSKTLLGVVIYEKSASQNGWIMTVTPVQTRIAWGEYGTDISGLPNYTSEASLTDIQASCTNTDKITAQGNSSKYQAAWAAKNYTQSNKTWCLPSAGLLNNINNFVYLSKINASITTANGKKLGFGSSCNYEEIWSSSEYDSNRIWSLTINSSLNPSYSFSIYYENKNTTYCTSVRPVMAF